MGTGDIKEASRLALEWWHELKRAPDTKQARGVSWPQLATSYLGTLPAGPKKGYHEATLNRHLNPFFLEAADLGAITPGLVSDYLAHRLAKGRTPPLPQTLNRENIVLRAVLKHAITKGWLQAAPSVPFLAERLTKRRRRHFTDSEYHLLRVTAIRRIRQYNGGTQPQLGMINLWQRRLLYDTVQLLANSGLRVDEMKTLVWRNVLWDTGDLLLEQAGKKRSTRRLILRQPAIRALRRIALRRLRWLADRDREPTLSPTESVLALPDGTPVRSFKSGFSALLDACGFDYATSRDRHALTSLRHTYATQALTRKSGSRPPLHVLAKQMGTSEKMIHAHYGHDAIEDYRDELRG